MLRFHGTTSEFGLATDRGVRTRILNDEIV